MGLSAYLQPSYMSRIGTDRWRRYREALVTASETHRNHQRLCGMLPLSMQRQPRTDNIPSDPVGFGYLIDMRVRSTLK